VVRSTVLPGTVANVVIPILEDCSGKKAGVDFGVAVNPEFLRESTAIADYDLPPMTVIGEFDKASGDVLQSLYEELDAPIIRKDIAVAEMIKYTCNVWHATKVTFANEIGNIAKAVGVDGREVMDVVCQDKTLNLSQYYMRPGFAFGGSCLPKDVRALTYRASSLDVEAPLLNSLMRSNESQVQNAFDIVESHDKRKVALLGLSFKAGTDDLRESPLVDLAEMLIGKGFDLRSTTATSSTPVSTARTRTTSSRRSRTCRPCSTRTSTT
jgi:GDP-mannose 6-dehydrogenase